MSKELKITISKRDTGQWLYTSQIDCPIARGLKRKKYTQVKVQPHIFSAVAPDGTRVTGTIPAHVNKLVHHSDEPTDKLLKSTTVKLYLD